MTLLRALSYHTSPIERRTLPIPFLWYRTKTNPGTPTRASAQTTINSPHHGVRVLYHWFISRRLGPCLCLSSYQTKRSPLSPSRHSYRNCAGIFALPSAETLHSRNTIDCLTWIVPLPRIPAMHASGTKLRGHLGPYLCRNCPIWTHCSQDINWMVPLLKIRAYLTAHGSLPTYSAQNDASTPQCTRC